MGGAWVAQSAERPKSAQVTISGFASSSPASGSVPTARSLEPALEPVSPSLSAPPPLTLGPSLPLKNIKKNFFLKVVLGGAWVAQSAERPTSAQVMISWSVSSSPASGSVLTAQSLEPALDSVSPSLSAPPPFMLCPSLSQK